MLRVLLLCVWCAACGVLRVLLLCVWCAACIVVVRIDSVLSIQVKVKVVNCRNSIDDYITILIIIHSILINVHLQH